MKTRFVCLLIFFGAVFAFGQNPKLDSVRRVIQTGNGKQQFTAMNALADYYSDNDLKQSLHYANLSLAKAKEIKNDSFVALAYNSIANVYQYKSQLDSALVFHRKALQVRQKVKDSLGMADTYNNIGIAYDQQANFPQALQYYFKALSYYDRKGLAGKQAMTYTNIGIVYKAQQEFQKALGYYQKAYEAYLQTDDDFGKTVSAGNLGSILINFKRYDESLKYSEIARKGYLKIDGDRFTGYPIANIAIVYDSLRNFEKANANYTDAMRLHEQSNNKFEVAETANSYAHSLIRQKKYAQSIAISEKAMAFAKQSNASLHIVAAYKNLSKANAMLGNFSEAWRYSNLYSAGKDSLFKDEKTKAVVEMATKYETEKKEQLLLAKEAEARQKNFVLIAVSLLALFVILIVLLLFRQQKLKNVQLHQEHQLKTAIAQIETQNKLQEQRLSISRDLHDNIGAQLTFIISSVENIKYAFEITNDKLSDKLQYISQFTQSTMLELRDTIWAMNHNSITFEDLRARILNFIEKAKDAADTIDFQFSVDENLGHLQLSSIEGMNLYRTIQEAVHNAVKYSEADQIVIGVTLIGDEIKTTISDNGIGFDKQTVQRGNGLANMEKRIEDIGGVFHLHSEPSHGTTITLLFKKPTHD
ncbi:tetratricopeptide repeat protein [Flavobacterium sp.]|uniref:tetratricopeptide repeat-containing sensor histidine kinase n=1 Tax=Flavobacterium sp. TaxID=239 RepID=UPI0039E353E0